MFGYSTDMRSLSSGRADYSMTPSHFDQVPQNLVQNIVETSSREPAEAKVMNGHKIHKIKRL